MTTDTEKKSWWHSLPGVLTGIAGVIAAVTALIEAIKSEPIQRAIVSFSAKSQAPAITNTQCTVDWFLRFLTDPEYDGALNDVIDMTLPTVAADTDPVCAHALKISRDIQAAAKALVSPRAVDAANPEWPSQMKSTIKSEQGKLRQVLEQFPEGFAAAPTPVEVPSDAAPAASPENAAPAN